jgi:capsular polysaccharide biosynthesis protein
MTRAATTDTVTVAPANNVYTVLAALATVAVAIGLVVLFLRANQLGIKLFG